MQIKVQTCFILMSVSPATGITAGTVQEHLPVSVANFTTHHVADSRMLLQANASRHFGARRSKPPSTLLRRDETRSLPAVSAGTSHLELESWDHTDGTEQSCKETGTKTDTCSNSELHVGDTTLKMGDEKQIEMPIDPKKAQEWMWSWSWECGSSSKSSQIPAMRTHLRVKWSNGGRIEWTALECEMTVKPTPAPTPPVKVSIINKEETSENWWVAEMKFFKWENCTKELNVLSGRIGYLETTTKQWVWTSAWKDQRFFDGKTSSFNYATSSRGNCPKMECAFQVKVENWAKVGCIDITQHGGQIPQHNVNSVAIEQSQSGGKTTSWTCNIGVTGTCNGKAPTTSLPPLTEGSASSVVPLFGPIFFVMWSIE